MLSAMTVVNLGRTTTILVQRFDRRAFMVDGHGDIEGSENGHDRDPN